MLKVISTAALLSLASVAAPYAQHTTTAQSSVDWTGFYVGAHAGNGWGNSTVLIMPDDVDTKGLLAGGQVGYNYDLGSFVLGAEADFSFADIRNVTTDQAATLTTRVENLATLRARLGVKADRFLPYVTAGLAIGSGSFTADLLPPFGPTNYVASRVHLGWTAGVGVEYAASDTISIRAEYLHTDLNALTYEQTPNILPFEAKHSFGVARVGINFRF